MMIATCKLGEKGCWNDGKCRATSNCMEKVVTNADRIRAMSDEELAQAIYEMVQGSVEGLLEMFDLPARIDSVVRVEPYKKRLLSWLQQPAEEVQ